MIQIVPAIDIIEGKCVRLSQGDYAQKKIYNENPVEVAKQFADAGCKRLHVVDLDGAKSQHIVNYNILERIASATSLTIDFGGGIKSDDDVRIAFNSGAEMITGGSIAVKNPSLFCSWLEKFGNEKIILGADTINGKIAISGWLNESECEIIPFIRQYQDKGISKVISTDIKSDGMLTGPSITLYSDILTACDGLHLIASGGVSGMEDIYKLNDMQIPEVIVGKAIYENRITIDDIEKFNK